jgi:chorismate mutase
MPSSFPEIPSERLDDGIRAEETGSGRGQDADAHRSGDVAVKARRLYDCGKQNRRGPDAAADASRYRSSEVGVEIDEVRKRIDLLDDVLLRIFNERARLALEIGYLKQRSGIPVFDPAREKRIFARMKEDNPGPLDDGAIVRLFERVVDESRRLERIMSQREGREGC